MRKYSGPLWQVVNEMEKDLNKTVFNQIPSDAKPPKESEVIEVRSGYRSAVRAAYVKNNDAVSNNFKVMTADSSLFSTSTPALDLQTMIGGPWNVEASMSVSDPQVYIQREAAMNRIKELEAANEELQKKLKDATSLPEAVETEEHRRKIRKYEPNE